MRYTPICSTASQAVARLHPRQVTWIKLMLHNLRLANHVIDVLYLHTHTKNVHRLNKSLLYLVRQVLEHARPYDGGSGFWCV